MLWPPLTAPTKSITPVYLTGISTKRSGHLRNEPALSIRGVGTDERRGMDSNTMYQSQGTLGAMLEDKFPQQQHIFSLSESSGTFFHHHNPPLSSDSNEATQSTGGSSSHSTHLHQANLLHLGQAMFELDFMWEEADSNEWISNCSLWCSKKDFILSDLFFSIFGWFLCRKFV